MIACDPWIVQVPILQYALSLAGGVLKAIISNLLSYSIHYSILKSESIKLKMHLKFAYVCP